MFLAVVAVFMPPVLNELTKTLIVFLKSSQEAFVAAGILASYASHIPAPH
jgi:hypothetical protein